jgi:hypothetical protein
VALVESVASATGNPASVKAAAVCLRVNSALGSVGIAIAGQMALRAKAPNCDWLMLTLSVIGASVPFESMPIELGSNEILLSPDSLVEMVQEPVKNVLIGPER